MSTTSAPPAAIRRYGFFMSFANRCSVLCIDRQNTVLMSEQTIASAETFSSISSEIGSMTTSKCVGAMPKMFAISSAKSEATMQGTSAE